MKFEWYTDFVDLEYTPSSDELLAFFKVTPDKGITLEEAAGRIASESSIGTWTTLTTMTPDLKKLMAKAYYISADGLVKIAYPLELFELDNIPQILSSVAGNIFGMRAIKFLKLLDIRFPRKLIDHYRGPEHGIEGVRRILKVYGRPITATVVKPKVGLTTERYAEEAYKILSGGIDLLKDDENLSSQGFNPFEKRLNAVMKVIEKIERETGEKKGYLINVTAETREAERRIKLVADYGNPFIMIDILTVGWGALQTLRELAHDYKLAIHAHRAFHAAFTRMKEHGMTMLVVAKLARLIGVDHIHVGSPVGKMEAKTMDVLNIQKCITEKTYEPATFKAFKQDWGNLKPVLPVSSGGLHPGLLPETVKIMGTDILIQVGGGVTGHPAGSFSGARAVRQALDAIKEGVSLEEYAETHPELKQALDKWGHVRPK
ncbi:MAG: type III ribulose-bisphosphate carboxylase [Thermoprotei archaeon]|nr:MAG: type III ribulose-bisphosphate carboxylase [Thermoprotei archaeon]